MQCAKYSQAKPQEMQCGKYSKQNHKKCNAPNTTNKTTRNAVWQIFQAKPQKTTDATWKLLNFIAKILINKNK